VICGDDLYGGTHRLFDQVWTRGGLEFDFIDLIDPDAVLRAARPTTKYVWLESPTNPTLKMADIAAIAERTHSIGAQLIVDNTFMSPVLQQPLALGADVELHSTTKYLNGHSDVIGGVIITSDDAMHEELAYLQNAVGAVPGPMDCFLTLRGLKTLHVRMERHCENAMGIARYLSGHSAIERVIFPGLESHPQHELAQRQMTGPGGMISVVVAGGLAGATRLLERTKIFCLAESLGGVESLIEHPALMTHAAVPEALRAALGIDDGLVRLSVGIEDLDDLIADLDQALS
jgi:cystathionine gamma-lyase